DEQCSTAFESNRQQFAPSDRLCKLIGVKQAGSYGPALRGVQATEHGLNSLSLCTARECGHKKTRDDGCGNAETASREKRAHLVQAALDSFLDRVLRDAVILSDLRNRAFIVESGQDANLLLRRQREDGFGQ